MPNDSQSSLHSWKEIANYLGVTERTAQTWERDRALPVRRIGGRVQASVADLDQWRLQGGAAIPWHRSWRFWRTVAITATVLLLAIVVALGRALIQQPARRIASARLINQRLVAFDETGAERWSWAVPNTTTSYDPGAERRLIRVVDVDGDGRREVLIGSLPAQETLASGSTVYCISEDGRERWRFVPGRQLQAEGLTGAGHMVQQLAVVADAGRPRRVVVSSFHIPYFPHQVAVLDSDGKLQSEYWHSGHLDHLETRDLDGDGRSELILGGVNNASGRATLIVLDLDKTRGFSAERKGTRYYLPGFEPAVERHRLLFPRTAINKALELYSWVESLEVLENEIRVVTGECRLGYACRAWYHFSLDLRLKLARSDDRLRSFHQELAVRGQLPRPYTDADERQVSEVTYLTPDKP